MLAYVFEVVPCLRLHRGRPAVEPLREPLCARGFQCRARLAARALHRCLDAASGLRYLCVRAALCAHRHLGQSIAGVERMRVCVDQPGCHQPAAAVVVVRHRVHQDARLAPLVAAPRDAIALEDDGRASDHAFFGACEQAPDVVEPPHDAFPTTDLPPTTTCVTSRAEQQKIRKPTPRPLQSIRGGCTVAKSASIPGFSSPASQPRERIPSTVAASSSFSGVWITRRPVARRWSSSRARASSRTSITELESDPRQSGLPASVSARSGPTRSPRSRSVVGPAQMRTWCDPSRLTSSALTWIAWIAVRSG